MFGDSLIRNFGISYLFELHSNFNKSFNKGTIKRTVKLIQDYVPWTKFIGDGIKYHPLNRTITQ